MMTIVVGMPCRESLRTVPQMAMLFARQIRPATAMRALRIPTSVFSTLATRTAQELQMSIPDPWKWNGRSVFIVDGSSVSMPDTPENQAMYPQPPTQAPGLGFPLARITVLLSLATGTCHDLEIAPYR